MVDPADAEVGVRTILGMLTIEVVWVEVVSVEPVGKAVEILV